MPEKEPEPDVPAEPQKRPAVTVEDPRQKELEILQALAAFAGMADGIIPETIPAPERPIAVEPQDLQEEPEEPVPEKPAEIMEEPAGEEWDEVPAEPVPEEERPEETVKEGLDGEDVALITGAGETYVLRFKCLEWFGAIRKRFH